MTSSAPPDYSSLDGTTSVSSSSASDKASRLTGQSASGTLGSFSAERQGSFSSERHSSAKLRKAGMATGLMARIKSNREFVSFKGLARNTFGGWFLGFGMAWGMAMIYNSTELFRGPLPGSKAADTGWLSMGWYFVVSALFYTMEFLWHAVFHPQTLDWDAFIVYSHSQSFHIALVVSLLEYMTEWYLFPSMKLFGIVHFIGLMLVLGGQFIRTAAMYTAGSNFTHIISTDKKSGHELVTTGIYSISRHPSYAGWFWWSIGTQLLLFNPLCTIGFALASFSFFRERIPFEEENLVDFFKEDYIEYRRRVPIGIPFLQEVIDKDAKNR